MTTAVPALAVAEVRKDYVQRRGVVPPQRRHRACGGRRQPLGRPRRDAGPCRRERLRQIDPGAHHRPPGGP